MGPDFDSRWHVVNTKAGGKNAQRRIVTQGALNPLGESRLRAARGPGGRRRSPGSSPGPWAVSAA